jgi:hypothetical protein
MLRRVVSFPPAAAVQTARAARDRPEPRTNARAAMRTVRSLLDEGLINEAYDAAPASVHALIREQRGTAVRLPDGIVYQWVRVLGRTYDVYGNSPSEVFTQSAYYAVLAMLETTDAP